MPFKGHAQDAETQSISIEKRNDWIVQAQKARDAQDYKGAIQFIDSILTYNMQDEQMLLFKGDVLMQDNNFKQAAKCLQALKMLQPKNPVSRINLSYALFKSHKPEKALHHAIEAWLIDTSNANAKVNYFNAMLWNKQTAEAKTFLKQYGQALDTESQLVLEARRQMTQGDFTKGLKLYDSLYAITKNKYYVQEIAEVLLGKGEANRSMTIMESRRDLFTESEWDGFIEKFNAVSVHRFGTELEYFKDRAQNIRQEASIFWQQGGTQNIKFGLRAGTAQFSVAGMQVSTMSFGQLNVRTRWNTKWSGTTVLTVQNIATDENQNFQTLVGRQTFKYQPHDKRMINVFYNAEVLNYTSTLLRKNIRAHDLGAITHILLSPRTGLYSQGSRAFIADGNRRTQFFGSLYHLFRTEPVLKVGWNNSYLHFSDNTIRQYFAPSRYLSTELFAEFQYQRPDWKNFFLNTQGGLGFQQIEKGSWETGYRYEAEVGFNSKRLDVSIKYRRSNVAFNSGTGYQFDWFTLKCIYKWN